MESCKAVMNERGGWEYKLWGTEDVEELIRKHRPNFLKVGVGLAAGFGGESPFSSQLVQSFSPHGGRVPCCPPALWLPRLQQQQAGLASGRAPSRCGIASCCQLAPPADVSGLPQARDADRRREVPDSSICGG